MTFWQSRPVRSIVSYIIGYPVRIAIDVMFWGIISYIIGYGVVSWFGVKVSEISWLNDPKKFLLVLVGWAVLSIVVGMLFGRAATIGGPEHRDPTEAEIKAAKEKYNNPYLDCSGDDKNTAINRYQTLVRITGARGVSPDLTLFTIVPGWEPDEMFYLHESHLPDNIRSIMERGQFPIWLIAEANLSAKRPWDLQLSKFELAPDPVPEEEL